MLVPYNRNLRERSREMRKDMTESERLFWSRVRRKQLGGAQFYRQKIIGSYIVDFYCPKARLVIEIDGDHHHEASEIEYDSVRDEYMQAQGLKVLRFSNREVLGNMAGVLEKVHGCL